MSAIPWRALHVVTRDAARAERLLLDTVDPWAVRAIASGALRRWYLIRPPGDPRTGASLLKLRLQGADDGHVADLCARAEAFLRRDAGPGESVAERPLAAEESRFGGAAGLAVALGQFPAATTVAIATMRRAPRPAERLHAAAELLLASAWAMGGDADAAEWLGQYASAQGLPPSDVDGARADATASYVDDGQAVAAQRQRGARRAVRDGDGFLGRWHRLMAATWAALSNLDDAGQLTVPAVSVYTNLVHMGHNRLALAPRDNAYLSWLLRLALGHDRIPPDVSGVRCAVGAGVAVTDADQKGEHRLSGSFGRRVRP